jgi:hypothetical protein
MTNMAGLLKQQQQQQQQQQRCWDRESMDIFNLILQPIWVFDIENKCMWWANKAAVELWNADTLQDLLSRDFASDMSEAATLRLADYMVKFQKGERINDQVSETMTTMTAAYL